MQQINYPFFFSFFFFFFFLHQSQAISAKRSFQFRQISQGASSFKVGCPVVITKPLTRAGDKFLSLGSLIFSQVSGYCDEIWPLNSSQRPSIYHWLEQPQRPHFCRDKSFLRHFCNKRVFVGTKHVFLSRQKYACDKTFVATKIFCCDKHNFVATKLLSRQAYFCRDERRVLSRHTRVCGDKSMLLAYFCRDKTRLLSRQTRACRDKHVFVAAKLLSWQKWYLGSSRPW